MVKLKLLRKLCLRGVISSRSYWEVKRIKQLQKKRWNRPKFTLEKFTAAQCASMFRFTPDEIGKLLDNFKIPAQCKLPDGQIFSGLEGLCILLRRLSYPNRLSDLEETFKMDSRLISKIFNWIGFNWMLSRLFASFGHVLTKLDRTWLTQTKLQEFANRCAEAGSWFPNLVGFIDGTSRPICRPIMNQREQYSGYKKQHVLKYQGIVFPNGIMGRLDGPFNGRRHNSAILHLSKIKRELEQLFVNADGSWFTLYGDTGYSNQKFVKVGFKNFQRLTNAQKAFNADMSALRVSVEYGFGKVLQQFAFLDFKKNQKLGLQYLKKQYHIAAFLTNCQICMRGCQVSKYFDCNPPTLKEYLQ